MVFNPGEISNNLQFYPEDFDHWKDFLQVRRNGGRVGMAEVRQMKQIWICPPPCGSCRKHFPDDAESRCSMLGSQSRCVSCDEKKWSCDWAQVYFRELARIRLEIDDTTFDRLESKWLRESGKQTNPNLLIPNSSVRVSGQSKPQTRDRKFDLNLVPAPPPTSASAPPVARTTKTPDSMASTPPVTDYSMQVAKGTSNASASAAAADAARPSSAKSPSSNSFTGRPWMLAHGSGNNGATSSEQSESSYDSEEEEEELESDTVPPRRNRPARLQPISVARRSPVESPSPAPLPPTEIADVHKLFKTMKPPVNPDEKVSISRGALYELRSALDIQAAYIKQLEEEAKASKQRDADQAAGQLMLDYPPETPVLSTPVLSGELGASESIKHDSPKGASPPSPLNGLLPAAWKPASPIASYCPADGSVPVNGVQLNSNGYAVEHDQNRMDTS